MTNLQTHKNGPEVLTLGPSPCACGAANRDDVGLDSRTLTTFAGSRQRLRQECAYSIARQPATSTPGNIYAVRATSLRVVWDCYTRLPGKVRSPLVGISPGDAYKSVNCKLGRDTLVKAIDMRRLFEHRNRQGQKGSLQWSFCSAASLVRGKAEEAVKNRRVTTDAPPMKASIAVLENLSRLRRSFLDAFLAVGESGGLYRLRQALTEFDAFEAARHGPEERPK